MACAKSKAGAGNNPDYADYIDYVNNQKQYASIACKRNKGFLPNFKPILSGLSTTTSSYKAYSLVYVYGSNFLPNGTTFIQFGTFGYLPATYYSSFNLSFQVPSNAIVGNYNVKVVNLYNNNFSKPVNQCYPGNLNYSNNSITYTIT